MLGNVASGRAWEPPSSLGVRTWGLTWRDVKTLFGNHASRPCCNPYLNMGTCLGTVGALHGYERSGFEVFLRRTWGMSNLRRCLRSLLGSLQTCLHFSGNRPRGTWASADVHTCSLWKKLTMTELLHIFSSCQNLRIVLKHCTQGFFVQLHCPAFHRDLQIPPMFPTPNPQGLLTNELLCMDGDYWRCPVLTMFTGDMTAANRYST